MSLMQRWSGRRRWALRQRVPLVSQTPFYMGWGTGEQGIMESQKHWSKSVTPCQSLRTLLTNASTGLQESTPHLWGNVRGVWLGVLNSNPDTSFETFWCLPSTVLGFPKSSYYSWQSNSDLGNGTATILRQNNCSVLHDACPSKDDGMMIYIPEAVRKCFLRSKQIWELRPTISTKQNHWDWELR